MKWDMVKLGDVFDVARGGSPRPIDEYWTEDIDGINWIMISDAIDNSKYIEKTNKKIRQEGKKKSRSVKTGDLLLTNSMSFGKPYILKTSGCIHDGWLVLSPIVENLSIEFMYYMLSSVSIKKQMHKNANGAVVKNLNKEIVANIEISLPPLDEQKRIAEILDKADAIIKKRQESLKLADEYIKSIFIEMFGDPVTNPMGWEKESLSQLGFLGRGVSKHRPRNASHLLNGEHPLVQTGDIAKAGLFLNEYTSSYSDEGLKQSKMWQKGTLCITIAANIAKTAILNFNACFPDSVVGFTANTHANTIFIHYWFSFFQAIIEQQAPESAQKNINLQILSELSIISPPIELQDKFAEIVEKVEKIKEKMQMELSEAQNLFKALQQRFFG